MSRQIAEIYEKLFPVDGDMYEEDEFDETEDEEYDDEYESEYDEDSEEYD